MKALGLNVGAEGTVFKNGPGIFAPGSSEVYAFGRTVMRNKGTVLKDVTLLLTFGGGRSGAVTLGISVGALLAASFDGFYGAVGKICRGASEDKIDITGYVAVGVVLAPVYAGIKLLRTYKTAGL